MVVGEKVVLMVVGVVSLSSYGHFPFSSPRYQEKERRQEREYGVVGGEGIDRNHGRQKREAAGLGEWGRRAARWRGKRGRQVEI